jgi:hypothetical protein
MPTAQNAVTQAKQPAKRKRGGQPGNTNAFKHGFYTKNFSLAERRGLQAANGVVLGDEIALLRVLIRRFAEEILSIQDIAPLESAQAEADSIRLSAVPNTSVFSQHLAVVSEAMLRLASLLRTDHMLGGSQSSTFIKQLSLVLEEITNENAANES